jgi:hypothetical protein
MHYISPGSCSNGNGCMHDIVHTHGSSVLFEWRRVHARHRPHAWVECLVRVAMGACTMCDQLYNEDDNDCNNNTTFVRRAIPSNLLPVNRYTPLTEQFDQL